ncbi:DUF4148 domain-containing protein [Paracidovorax avenae]|uniref:DUF4148 domain-containing protein n=1 Tax=Paracidovorax avenae TaxID=80867 RepID=UPI000D21BBA5|nr:DUF4148 domain-containing protein [Paracidovorax avenae]AVS83623.1 DUF4148 domain-containing protein [Paracidovorax avenae]
MTARHIPRIAFGTLGLSLLLLSSAASANGYWHPANTEEGVTVHPGHAKSDTTREQVRAEAIKAMRNGGLWQMTESGEPPRLPQQPAAERRNASAAGQQGASE